MYVNQVVIEPIENRYYIIDKATKQPRGIILRTLLPVAKHPLMLTFFIFYFMGIDIFFNKSINNSCEPFR